MGDTKESIEIRKHHDNDKYTIIRKIVEDIDGEQLAKITGEIKEALDKTETDLSDIPKQAEARRDVLEKQRVVLQERYDAFQEHARFLKKDEDEVKVIDVDGPKEPPAAGG